MQTTTDLTPTAVLVPDKGDVSSVTQTPTIPPSPTVVPDPTPTDTPIATPTAAVTPSPEPTITEAIIPTPTVTPSPEPVQTPDITPTDVPPAVTPTDAPKVPAAYFDNPLVEEAVREATGNPDRALEPEDFVSVITLDLSECGLNDIGFLREFGNLRELDLSWNNISEFVALPELKHLTKLDLSYNFISDIQVLSSYTELMELSLRANDIEVLTKATEPTDTVEQEEVTVQQVQSVFEEVSGLTRLDLSYNMLTAVSGLEGLTALEYLNLEGNQIIDFSTVEFVPELVR